jgi:ferredoxin
VHELDPALCERCGLCYEVCNFDAIEITSPRVEVKMK